MLIHLWSLKSAWCIGHVFPNWLRISRTNTARVSPYAFSVSTLAAKVPVAAAAPSIGVAMCRFAYRQECAAMCCWMPHPGTSDACSLGPVFSTRAFFLCDDDPCNDLLFSREVWTVMLPGKFLGARGQGIPRPICQTCSLGGGRDSCFPKTISLSFLRFPSHHALEKESSLTYPVNLMQICRKQYFPNCMVGC
jgi:hypothetical protein